MIITDVNKHLLQNSLENHKRRHTGEKPFKCDLDNCGKCFVSCGELCSHRKSHLNVKKHQCDWEGCNRRYMNAGLT